MDEKSIISAIDRAQGAVPKYVEIMDWFLRTDVSRDRDFQRAFNHFYRIRQRSEAWYRIYYGYMEVEKGRHPSFGTTLRFLNEKLARYEPSFASKLVATHDPTLPVWDTYVLGSMGIEAPSYGARDRFERAEHVYRRIQAWYEKYLASPTGLEIISLFDDRVPEKDRLTNLKKLDFVLWQMRPDGESPQESEPVPSGTNASGSRRGYSASSSVPDSPPDLALNASAQPRQSGDTMSIPVDDVVFLISCVSRKRSQPSQARDLYVSDWFNKARAFVERAGAPWFVLSAEYGLVKPDAVIAPYEKTLNTMGIRERQAWASQVIEQMERELPRAKRVVLFAGHRYREFLIQYLSGRFEEVVVPLEGLRIGEQLSWFSKNLERRW